MSITAYGSGALAARHAETSFRSLKTSLADLQAQLTTGQKASSHAELGASAIKSLSGRATLATLEAYATNVSDATFRVKLMATGIEQIARIGSSLTVSLPTSLNAPPIGQTSAIASAEDGLKQVIDILNSDIAGRALFGGRDASGEPVEGYDLILNGDAGRAGLRQMIAERKEADLGADGLGRLVIQNTASGIRIQEEAAGLPFGMKIAAASASGSGLAASSSAGPPPIADFAATAQPEPGGTIALTLSLPDGSTTTVTLKALTQPSTDGSPGFVIGATLADTQANLRAALRDAVATTASTSLASASSLAASTAFFAGSPSHPPMRIAGPPYATATAIVAGTASDTVIWYKGDDGAGSARETAPVRTGDGTSVAIGARADEPAFRKVLAALGALAANAFPEGDATATARYAALAERVSGSLADDAGIRGIATDFAIASKDLASATDRLGAAKAQVRDMLSGIEDADPNEVAMALLATQTRLQASYQVTSALSRLSLVEFI
ncbi:flagellin [Enterovirga rhinocerotis]|uniref:Flagellin-like protein n=1 Tax=Enterovirga rhinocerotis TaxID=1339210 RepID=A0A4R7BJP1_9HYPH|nr:flagellin [Enterovirga rhinocerotis]TDR85213.1 flagellin-like protein [Enterovirga rhinocerotis]